MRIGLIMAMLFAMFLPMVGLFAESLPDKAGKEVTFEKMVPAPVLAMVIVKVEKFVPFIRIVDSRRRLLRQDDLNPIELLVWWKAHLRNPIYASSGGDLPVKV
jgi:hypothetical protein